MMNLLIHLNKEIDGFNIISYNNKDDNKFIEFYLSSFKNTIFKLELYSSLGAQKLIFDSINLKDNFINSLEQKSGEYFYYLRDFFKMIIKLNS